MNRQRRLNVAPIQLPSEIKCELYELMNIGGHIEKLLKEKERSGEILEKSTDASIEARKAGNQLYVKKGHNSQIHNEILCYYSRSIAFAPKGKEELVLGYSNRSSLLMHLGLYKESLIDIDRALNLSIGDKLKDKLLTRKEKCLGLLNEKILKESTKNLNLGDRQDLENLASKLMNFKPSATVSCASDSVGLGCNDTFGRHLVATRDIEPGEILIVEQGYAGSPFLDQRYLVCSHCLQVAWNGIPCDNCVFTIYCSEECKNEAFNEYHDIECSMLKYLYCTVFYLEKEACHRMTSIRLFIKALKKEGFDSIMKEASKKRNEEKLDGLLFKGILQSDKFKPSYNLLSLAKVYEKDKKMHEFGSSVILYLLIEQTDFLNFLVKKNGLNDGTVTLLQPVFYDNDLLNPYVLLKLKEILTNIHHVIFTNEYMFESTMWNCDCTVTKEKCYPCKGVVIVPCCSLLNHSCTPNVSHLCTPKRKIIVFSTCPIKKGEMLCDSYTGISILKGDLKSRQNKFKEFYFTCKCKACLDNVNISMITNDCAKDSLTIITEFEKHFPMALTKLSFQNSVEDFEMSEEFLQHVIKMSKIFYQNFDCYKAFVHNNKCQAYIEKMMSKLYEGKNHPSNCS